MLSHQERTDLSQSHVILSCEGGAEKAIAKILLDGGVTIFSDPDNDVQITGVRSAKRIEEEYLSIDYEKNVAVVRFLDSRNENFKLGRLYRDNTTVVSLTTHPEIEILIILAEGRYQEYWQRYRHSMKASEYCSGVLGYGNVKSQEFVYNFFSDIDRLTGALQEHRSLRPEAENCIADILR